MTNMQSIGCCEVLVQKNIGAGNEIQAMQMKFEGKGK